MTSRKRRLSGRAATARYLIKNRAVINKRKRRHRALNVMIYKMYDALMRAIHPQKIKAKNARYRRDHAVKHLAAAKAWNAANPERRRAADKRYSASHPERWPSKAARRNQAISFDLNAEQREAIARIYARAKELRRWFNVVVDHIKAIAQGGLHTPGNLQIIYEYENTAKGVRSNYVPTVIFT